MENRRLLQDCLTIAYEKYPNDVVAVVGSDKYLYRDLYQESQNIAKYLKCEGFQRGDRAAIFIENSWDILTSIFGILYAGGTFLIINHLTKQDKLAYILNDSGAIFLFSDAMVSKHFIPAVKLSKTIKAVVYAGQYIDEIDDLPLVKFESIHDDFSKEGYIQSKCISLDLAALIYTSGSTGDAKGVMMSHANMLFTCDSLIEYLRLKKEAIIFCFLPFAFDYGLYQILMTVRLGSRIVIEKSFAFPGLVFDGIINTKANVFPGVPTVYSTIINMYRKKTFSLPSITNITNTAASLPDEYIPILKKIFPNAHIFKMYGLTECKRVSYLEPEFVDSHPSSVGKAIPGTEIMLLDQDKNPVVMGQEGILYVRGAHIMQGYWNKPKQSEQMLCDDIIVNEKVLCTYDRFCQDSDGFLYFKGRTDEIIKTRGEKVSPIEVENVLHSISGIKEAAVLGIPDAIEGQYIKAFVSLSDGVSMKPRQIRQHCIARLENFMVPREILIIDVLPKTLSNKINKKELIKNENIKMKMFKGMLEELSNSLKFLIDKPEETPETTLKALWAFAQGNAISSSKAKKYEVSVLNVAQEKSLKELILQRVSGIPLSHITGRQEFMGIDMLCNKDALIPRKETEILANLAIKCVDELADIGKTVRVIDVCTGSGNLALAVSIKCKNIVVWGSDLSEDAIELAKNNAELLGVKNNVNFISGDLFSPFNHPDFYGKVDLIICNPPYIITSNVEKMPDEISKHEPDIAFNGGPFGIKILDRVISDAKLYLNSGAWICVEVGAGQAPFIEKRFKKSGSYKNIESVFDDKNVARAIRAQYIIE